MSSIYLNNAATTWPKPKSVASSIYNFVESSGANLARGTTSRRDIETLDDVYNCRSMLAELLGGYEKQNPKYVTFTKNATESINTVLKGILKPGMKVLTSSMEHNAVIRPLRELEKDSIYTTILQCSMRGYLDSKKVENALKEGADLAIFSHCSNVSGSLQNIETISEICAKYNVPLVIDAAQTAGIVPIDVASMKLAALCFTGHKALLGPQGIGGIVWHPDFARKCATLIEGGTGSFSSEEHQPEQLPDKFEAGTPNMLGVVGLLSALKWIESIGIFKIHSKEKKLGKRLEEGLRSIKGLRILGPCEDDARLSVYAFNIDNKDNAVLAMELSEKYGIETRPGLHCAPLAHRTLGSFPEGALRISPGYFSTEEEIDKTINAIKALSK